MYYNDLSEEAKARLQKARKKLATINDYVDVTPEMSARIGTAWNRLTQIDPAGHRAEEFADKVLAKFTTQSF